MPFREQFESLSVTLFNFNLNQESMDSVIVGTWKLLSFELQRENGELEYPFGKDAIGYVNYTASGHFSVQYMPKEQDEENLKGISYFGSYDYNREKDYIIHHVEGSLFPNDEGLDKIRKARFRGRSLKITWSTVSWGADEDLIATISFEKQEELPPVRVTF